MLQTTRIAEHSATEEPPSFGIIARRSREAACSRLPTGDGPRVSKPRAMMRQDVPSRLQLRLSITTYPITIMFVRANQAVGNRGNSISALPAQLE